MVARGVHALTEVRDRIAAAGGDVVIEPADASDGDAMVALAQRVLARDGTPEVIVNAAGAGQWRFIEDTAPAEAVAMMGAPFFAAFNTTHAFMNAMLARGSGVVVHVGSPAALGPWPGATAYTSARWALRGLHEALRQDLRGTGVQSCHVMFGEVSSPYFETNDVPRDQLPKLSRWLPVISPRECAGIIMRTVENPRPQVLHPPVLRGLYAATRCSPGLGRRIIAWGGPHH